MRHRISFALLASFMFAPLTQADWPNFLGPHHNSVSDETGFKKEWGEPLKLSWERKVGSAFSSFAAVGNRIYTCGMSGGQQVLFCLDANSGQVIWEKPFEKEYLNEHGDGTRSTPTVHDGKVYILGAHGRLLCVNAEDGKDVWEAQFKSKPTWAYSGSVLIEGEHAIASAGAGGGALVAFAKGSGKELWTAGTDPVGYATPYPFTFQGQRYVVGFLGNSAMIVEAQTGKQVWRLPWRTDWDVNAASPIFHDGHLFLSSGYTTGSALVKLTRNDADFGHSIMWKSDVLMSKFQSGVLHEGRLYASDQNALKCVDFMTGKELWKKARVRNGTLILAEEHLILLTEDGKLQIAKASPQDFLPITDAQILDGRCWSQPVLHQGKLYARNLERVVCFDLK